MAVTLTRLRQNVHCTVVRCGCAMVQCVRAMRLLLSPPQSSASQSAAPLLECRAGGGWRTVLLGLCVITFVGCGDAPPATESSTDLAVLDTLRRTDPSQGRTALMGFVEEHPDDDLAWVNLGHAHEQMGELTEAEAAYLKALEINSRRFEALTGLGIVSRKRREYDRALAYYERALTIQPDYAPAYSSMAVIALKQRRDRQALEYAQRAWQLDRQDPVIAANLAAAYHYLGQYPQRDQMSSEARRLGYRNVAGLDRVFRGEATLR